MTSLEEARPFTIHEVTGRSRDVLKRRRLLHDPSGEVAPAGRHVLRVSLLSVA
jgi:hypothetical protein